jgi:hypothetical protein
MQFVLIMDIVVPKLNAYQFKQILEALYHDTDTDGNDSTRRRVNRHMKLLDETTGHTKSDFMAVLVSDVNERRRPQFKLYSTPLFLCAGCMLPVRFWKWCW